MRMTSEQRFLGWGDRGSLGCVEGRRLEVCDLRFHIDLTDARIWMQ